jgi:25S rRNA (uracil2634-N3)-methyltransferase
MGKRRQISSTSKKNKPHHHQQAAKNAKPTGITKPQPSKRKPQASQSKPIIPFEKHESILLIGEADLSFTISLLLHHHCTNLTATVLEASESELIAKYPQAASNIQTITQGGGVIKFGVDVQKKGCVKRAVGGGGKKYERVFFNFPHVGGKSTDVNRQVRYNQGPFYPSPPFRPLIKPHQTPSPSTILLTTQNRATSLLFHSDEAATSR